jgi:ketosteroid isomerase-like protein
MSQENVETVRGVYAEWAEGNFRAGMDLYDPLILFVQGQGFPEQGAYLGLDGIQDFTSRFLEAWERVTMEALEVLDAGNSVVARVIQRAIGRGSGIQPGQFGYFQVWTFRGGKVIRLDTIRDRDAALEAAGLSE